MKKSALESYKTILLNLKNEILNQGYLKSNLELNIPPEELADTVDQANMLEAQEINFELRDRELNKLRMIEACLEKVEQKTYGLCDECGEPINEKRLHDLPLTCLCLEHAEEAEEFKKAHQHSSIISS